MAAPYELGWAQDRIGITAETSPNDAYRSGWRDCIRHLMFHQGEVFIQDDSGAFMCQPGHQIVYDVINAWPDPYEPGCPK